MESCQVLRRENNLQVLKSITFNLWQQEFRSDFKVKIITFKSKQSIPTKARRENQWFNSYPTMLASMKMILGESQLEQNIFPIFK